MKLRYCITAILALLILTSCGNPTVRSSGDTPQRIVVTAPATAEILVGLGIADNLIASEINSADIAGIDHSRTEFIDLADMGIERILELEPDLFIHSNTLFFDAPLSQTNPSSSLHELMLDLGINVIYIEEPVSISEIYEQIELLGEITGRQREAANMINQMKSTLSNIENSLNSVAERRRVYFEVSPTQDIYTFGGNTFFNELLTLAGGENIFEDERGWFSPSAEAVVLSDPDVIITNSIHYNSVIAIKARPGWWSTTAVINEEVHLVSPNYTKRPSQNVVRAVEEIAAVLYPELFR